MLDIGCGSGHLLARLHGDGVGLVAGVELQLRLKEARSLLPTGQFVCADLQRGLPLNAPGMRFRVAVIADVVEHLANGEELLTVLCKPAEEGGSGFARLVISIPNVGYWRVRAMLLRGHWTYEEHGILDRTHVRFYSLISAAELLQDAGWLVGAYHVIPGKQGIGRPRADGEVPCAPRSACLRLSVCVRLLPCCASF